jgi:membrane fusion protein, multidrug efflux system
MRYLKFVFLWMLVLECTACSSPPKANQLPTVAVAKVEQRDVPIYVDAIGQAFSTVTVEIRPQVAGKLLKTYIQQGDLVKEGQIIYTVDPRPYQAILDEAKAQLKHDIAVLEYANITVERFRPVVEEDFLAIWTFEEYVSAAAQAQAQVELDQAAVVAAQINVDFCNIVAPVTGKVSEFVVDVGNIVAIDDPTAIVSIRPFSPIDILFSLPQQQLELIRRVQGNEGRWKFVAVLPEHPNEKFEGITYFIDNDVNQDTGTIMMKGRVANNDWHFWPGEFVKVQVLHKMAPQALVVNPGAVLVGKNGPYLYTVDAEGKARAHNVTVLIRTDEYIAVSSNEIHANDLAIIDGQINIAPGMQVQIAEDTNTESNKPQTNQS